MKVRTKLTLILSVFLCLIILACNNIETSQKKNQSLVKPAAVKTTVPKKQQMVKDIIKKEQPVPVASVTMKDGTVYRLKNYRVLKYTHSGNFYTRGNSFKVDYIPIFYNDSILFEFPVDKVTTIKFYEKAKYSSNMSAKVLTTDGREFEGVLDARSEGHDHKVYGISGRTYKEGYPASYEPSIRDISIISFGRDKDGKIVTEVKKKDGSVTSGIKEIKFAVESSDSRSQTGRAGTIKLKVGDTILEIPIEDIKSITNIEKRKNQENHLLELNKGKTLEGTIQGSYGTLICGKTTALEEDVDFISRLYSIKSIVFNPKSSKPKEAIK